MYRNSIVLKGLGEYDNPVLMVVYLKHYGAAC